MATDMNAFLRSMLRGAADGAGFSNTETSNTETSSTTDQQQLHRSRTERLADQLTARLNPDADNRGDH